MRAYFEFAGQTRILVVMLIAMTILLALIFPNLPIGGDLFDTKPGYSFEEANTTLTAYGPDGRTTYAWASATLDTLLPFCYVTFFVGLIYRFRLTEQTWYLAFIPIVAGVIDLLENIQIILMLVQYPEISPSQVASASTFTLIKQWMSPIYQLLGFGLLLIAIVKALVRKSRGKSDESDT